MVLGEFEVRSLGEEETRGLGEKKTVRRIDQEIEEESEV